MKWTDLQIGDKLRIRKEAIEFFKNEKWIEDWDSETFLEIANIITPPYSFIIISVINKYGSKSGFYIREDGSFETYSLPFFEIVEVG